jgi:hypothetical protein
MQQLLNKTPQIQMDTSSEKQTQLLKTYYPLLEKSLSILSSYSLKNKYSNDEQAFIQTLFSLISKLACTKLPKQIISTELEVIFKYLKNCND